MFITCFHCKSHTITMRQTVQVLPFSGCWFPLGCMFNEPFSFHARPLAHGLHTALHGHCHGNNHNILIMLVYGCQTTVYQDSRGQSAETTRLTPTHIQYAVITYIHYMLQKSTLLCRVMYNHTPENYKQWIGEAHDVVTSLLLISCTSSGTWLTCCIAWLLPCQQHK